MARAATAAEIERAAIVLLYHPVTGAIVHVHYATADPGSDLPGRPALEREAVEYAKRRRGRRGGIAVEKLARFHTDPRRFRADRAYTIDVRKRSLVPAARRQSSPRRSGR